MPGDEVQYEGTEAGSRNRTGPRHAAPKKPLITRLNMPAGKAIAIAAMPTSILMGMGLTPTLAHAKPIPDNPFRDGPCVTAPDKEAEEAEKEKAEKEKAEQEAKEAAEKATSTPSAGEQDQGDEPEPSPSSGDSAGSGDQADEPAPEPSESESTNPLDPLGVGDAIKDVFTPDEKESEEPAPEPSASEDEQSDVTDPVKDTVDGVKDTTDKVTDGAKDAADKAKEAADKLKPSPEATDPLAPDADGKKPFPCVVEKKVDGDDETTPAPIPDDPWNLEASSLLLKGADYKGIVNVTTAGGKTKQVMKYVISKGTDIGDLHQTVEGPGGQTYHIQSAKGATSTIRDGETIMYTERLSGHLFGLIPVTFDPEHPPPLNIPTIYLTNVKVVQAAQFGGTLTVPGFHQEITE
ncbi:hypothetical protein [Streptomyces cavernicola]|uniref:Hydrogenase expression protein HypF n=1 Tax=Streptomyces cavernicola TaxID=3043613 RepID=A0ABT6S8N4_9ACTN|nr:hypothetical protein [Streptomyces sp. B-S-A6]MDI3404459.1 hypothetical protein [Streptomyces sp. B-S-A6]